jgi:hypothetical protein
MMMFVFDSFERPKLVEACRETMQRPSLRPEKWVKWSYARLATILIHLFTLLARCTNSLAGSFLRADYGQGNISILTTDDVQA